MWVFALSIVRRSSRFELFYFTHLLYVVWFVLAIVHSTSFLFWAGAPLLGFAIEHVLRLGAAPRRRVITESQALALRRDAPRARAARRASRGAPATTRSCASPRSPSTSGTRSRSAAREESGALTFHVRSLGNWTAALRRRVERNEASGTEEHMEAYVDGPYGSPSAHIFDSRFAVFIGAGIGVTPFASVLASFVLRANGDAPAQAHEGALLLAQQGSVLVRVVRGAARGARGGRPEAAPRHPPLHDGRARRHDRARGGARAPDPPRRPARTTSSRASERTRTWVSPTGSACST